MCSMLFATTLRQKVGFSKSPPRFLLLHLNTTSCCPILCRVPLFARIAEAEGAATKSSANACKPKWPPLTKPKPVPKPTQPLPISAGAGRKRNWHGPCLAEPTPPPTVPTLARKSHARSFVLVQRYFARCKSFCIGSPIVPWPYPRYTLISIVEVFLDWF
jgi:hypothetical protein